MATRPGLSEQVVIEAAIALADEKGLEKVSLATLAQHFKVKPPSLYNHIDGLEGLRRAMTLRGLEALTTMMRRAAMGRVGFDALREVAKAYRDFAKHHPGLYPLTLRANRASDEELAQAGGAALEVVLAVLRGYKLEHDDALHAVRALRSALHGFVSLELHGGFGLPLELDDSFERLVVLLDRGLQDFPSRSS